MPFYNTSFPLARLCWLDHASGWRTTSRITWSKPCLVQKQGKGKELRQLFEIRLGTTTQGNFLNLPYFSALQQSLSVSRFTHFNSLRFWQEKSLLRLQNEPRFIIFPGVWLLHHFLSVVTVVWLAAVDFLLFAEDDERVSTRSQPFERTTGIHSCIRMGMCFSIIYYTFVLSYSV